MYLYCGDLKTWQDTNSCKLFFLRLNEQYEQASVHLWDLLEGKEKPICGTTCKYSLCIKRWHTEFVLELKYNV